MKKKEKEEKFIVKPFPKSEKEFETNVVYTDNPYLLSKYGENPNNEETVSIWEKPMHIDHTLIKPIEYYNSYDQQYYQSTNINQFSIGCISSLPDPKNENGIYINDFLYNILTNIVSYYEMTLLDEVEGNLMRNLNDNPDCEKILSLFREVKSKAMLSKYKNAALRPANIAKELYYATDYVKQNIDSSAEEIVAYKLSVCVNTDICQSILNLLEETFCELSISHMPYQIANTILTSSSIRNFMSLYNVIYKFIVDYKDYILNNNPKRRTRYKHEYDNYVEVDY